MFRDNPTQDHPKILSNKSRKDVAEKFSFFCDCFNISNVKANEFFNYEAETHLSLVESMLCIVKEAQLVSKDFFTVEYIKYILKTHSLFNSDRILKKYYSSIQNNIKNIDGFSGNWKTVLPQINSELSKIFLTLSTDYIENIIKEISLHVICQHKLSRHKDDFDYYSRLLVSYFYFLGYSRKRISGIVRNVLDKDVDVSGNNIGVDFPIPKNLYDRLLNHNRNNLSFDKQLFNDLESYSSTRSMNQQIESFLYLTQYEKHQFTFYFKLEGIYLKTENDLIDGMRILSPKTFNNENKQGIEDAFSNENLKAFLQGQIGLIEYKVFGYSQNEASEIAIIELKRKIGRLSMYINKKLNLETYQYIGKLKSGQIHLYEYYERTQLYGWDIDLANKRLKNSLKPEFKTYLDNLENVLIDALAEIDSNKSLHTYSKFCEQLINKVSHNISNTKEFKIPARVLCPVYILLLSEKEHYQNHIKIWGYNIVSNASFTKIRLKESDQKVKKLFNSRKFISLARLYRLIDNQHSLYRIKTAYKYKEQENLISAFHYYTRFILMLTKYRNIQEHSNIVDENIKRKLRIAANIILNRVVQSISKEMHKPDNLSLSANEIVTNLIVEGKKKFDSLNPLPL